MHRFNEASISTKARSTHGTHVDVAVLVEQQRGRRDSAELDVRLEGPGRVPHLLCDDVVSASSGTNRPRTHDEIKGRLQLVAPRYPQPLRVRPPCSSDTGPNARRDRHGNDLSLLGARLLCREQRRRNHDNGDGARLGGRGEGVGTHAERPRRIFERRQRRQIAVGPPKVDDAVAVRRARKGAGLVEGGERGDLAGVACGGRADDGLRQVEAAR